MAERRMFAKAVTTQLKFLTLSPLARLLYFDLGMAADDDGVVEAFMVIRMTGASTESLYELEEKGYIDLIDEENLVAYIIDWHTNNHIRKDRYRESYYAPLLREKGYFVGWSTNGQPSVNQNGNQWDTQYSLGKERIVKSRKEKGSYEGEREPYPFENLINKDTGGFPELPE